MTAAIVVIVVAGADLIRRLTAGPPPGPAGPARQTRPAPSSPQPPREPVRVGQLAPDFRLLDGTGTERRLAELVRGPTLLCFSCGCAFCRAYHLYLRKLLAGMRGHAPQVVTVTTQAWQGEAAYRRDIPLAQTLLYEERNGPVMAQYEGHPCPRTYGLDGKRKVLWIGPSLRSASLKEIALYTAAQLGYRTDGSPDSKRPRAPGFQAY